MIAASNKPRTILRAEKLLPALLVLLSIMGMAVKFIDFIFQRGDLHSSSVTLRQKPDENFGSIY